MFKKLVCLLLMPLTFAFQTGSASQFAHQLKLSIKNPGSLIPTPSPTPIAKISFHKIYSRFDLFFGLGLDLYVTGKEFNYLRLVANMDHYYSGERFINCCLRETGPLSLKDPDWNLAVKNFNSNVFPKIHALYSNLRLYYVLQTYFKEPQFWRKFVEKLNTTHSPYHISELPFHTNYPNFIRQKGGILTIWIKRIKGSIDKYKWFVDIHNFSLLPQIREKRAKWIRPIQKYEPISHYYNNVAFQKYLPEVFPIIWIQTRTIPWVFGEHEKTIYLKIAETMKISAWLFPEWISLSDKSKDLALPDKESFINFTVDFWGNDKEKKIESLLFVAKWVA